MRFEFFREVLHDWLLWDATVEDASHCVSLPCLRMLVVTLNSLLKLIPWLLRTAGLKYVLTAQLSQDYMEVCSLLSCRDCGVHLLFCSPTSVKSGGRAATG